MNAQALHVCRRRRFNSVHLSGNLACRRNSEMKMLMCVSNQQRWWNFNLICLANHFHWTANERTSAAQRWLPMKLSLLSTIQKRRHKTEEKFAIHEIQQLFSLLPFDFYFISFVRWVFFFVSPRNSISIIGENREEKQNIWIKSFLRWATRWKSAYRRAIIESQLRIWIASRD